MKELASLHDQHLNRPTLDDSSEQEHAIEITTQEVTQVRQEVSPQPQDHLSRRHWKSPKSEHVCLQVHCPAGG